MKIYLAGFDVFRQDAVAYGETLKAECAGFGFVGLFPLDNTLAPGASGRPAAEAIYRANLDLIRQADAVMANLNRFRGHEPDSGTAFEVGFATALGKPVWGYTGEHADLLGQHEVVAGASGQPALDAQGYVIEDFGLNVNLMLACAARIVVGDVRDCLAAMAEAAAIGGKGRGD